MIRNRRVVFDCNVLLQGIASPNGPAGRCAQMALDGRIELFVSPAVLAELRDVSSRPKVVAKLRLTPEQVQTFLQAIELTAIFVDQFPERFKYDRDPDDALYVNLALAADASLVVSHDRDLLDLMDSSRPEGLDFQSRFPQLQIATPPTFLREIDAQSL